MLPKPRIEPYAKSTPLLLMEVEVHDDDIQRAQGLISQCLELAFSSGGSVREIAYARLMATFDCEPHDLQKAESVCGATAAALHTLLGDNGKILYGTCEGIYGNLGSACRMQAGPLIRNISDLLQRLRAMELGSVEHI